MYFQVLWSPKDYSLPYSQQPAIAFYPELAESGLALYFFKVYFNILPFTPGSSKWALPFKFGY
jgi:hypothetical protein